ncbi:MAG: hypothetical protein AAFQ88_08240 [Pseudomonadota bacterium]
MFENSVFPALLTVAAILSVGVGLLVWQRRQARLELVLDAPAVAPGAPVTGRFTVTARRPLTARGIEVDLILSEPRPSGTYVERWRDTAAVCGPVTLAPGEVAGGTFTLPLPATLPAAARRGWLPRVASADALAVRTGRWVIRGRVTGTWLARGRLLRVAGRAVEGKP